MLSDDDVYGDAAAVDAETVGRHLEDESSSFSGPSTSTSGTDMSLLRRRAPLGVTLGQPQRFVWHYWCTGVEPGFALCCLYNRLVGKPVEKEEEEGIKE